LDPLLEIILGRRLVQPAAQKKQEHRNDGVFDWQFATEIGDFDFHRLLGLPQANVTSSWHALQDLQKLLAAVPIFSSGSGWLAARGGRLRSGSITVARLMMGGRVDARHVPRAARILGLIGRLRTSRIAAVLVGVVALLSARHSGSSV